MNNSLEETNGSKGELLQPSGITWENLQRTAQQFDQQQISQAEAKTKSELNAIKNAQHGLVSESKASDDSETIESSGIQSEFVTEKKAAAELAVNNFNQALAAILLNDEAKKYFSVDDIHLQDISKMNDAELWTAHLDLKSTFASLQKAQDEASTSGSPALSEIRELVKLAAQATDRVEGLIFAINPKPALSENRPLSEFQSDTLKKLTSRLKELNTVESTGTLDTSAEQFAIQAAIHGVEENFASTESFDQYIARFDLLFEDARKTLQAKSEHDARLISRLRRPRM